MHAGVVGAGPAGLCAARHVTDQGMLCTVFEQIDTLGGTWVYTDDVGTDKFGIPIHTSMYKNLKFNLPKELVMYPDFPYKIEGVSYLSSEQMLDYLNDYVDHYNIRKCIKFNHHVKKVSRYHDLWEVIVLDLKQNQESVYHFDVIFICNGLSNTPVYPTITGLKEFKGKMLHTHDYRVPEHFQGNTVLFIGGGPSAMDISDQIADVSPRIVVSHHSKKFALANYKNNVFQKPDVKEVKERSVVFVDDTEEDFDSIIFATGYTVNYSFLDDSCGITVSDRNIFPLYKFIINANQPTMCIIGNLIYSIQLPVFDLQIRFFLKTLKGKVLPSQEEMIQDVSNYTKMKIADSGKTKDIFVTNDDEDNEYYAMLTAMADIEPMPPVMAPLYQKAKERLYANFQGFRNDVYEVIDPKHTFILTIPKS